MAKIGLFGLVVLTGAALLLGADLREAARRDASREVASITYLLADHAGRLFEVADVALRYASRAIEGQ